MNAKKLPARSLIIAERDYHPFLFRYQNHHPELNLKIITRSELLDMISFSYRTDPIPYLIREENIEYTKAKKWMNLLRTADRSKNKTASRLYDDLKANGYIREDPYGKYQLSLFSVHLFERDEDTELSTMLRDGGIPFSFLHMEDLLEEGDENSLPDEVLYFSDKFEQYFYIFSDIRKRILENDSLKGKIRILVEETADEFYVRLLSSLFNLPVFLAASHGITGDPHIREKIQEIHKRKSMSFSDDERKIESLLMLERLVKTYHLDEITDFSYAYANLLEVVDATSFMDLGDRKGILVTNRYTFDPSYLTYVTNFQFGSFYQEFADDNVLPDAELVSMNVNPSYTKTLLDRREKENYVRYNNIVVLSRVTQHLTDKIFDSQFIEEWNRKKSIRTVHLKDETSGVYTEKAALLYAMNILDKAFYRKKDGKLNSYDHAYNGWDDSMVFDREHWHLTDIESYMNCPFRYLLEEILPCRNKKYPAYRGTLVHKVMEGLYHPDFDFDTAFEEGVNAFKKQMEADGYPYTEKEETFLRAFRYWLDQAVHSLLKTRKNMNLVTNTEDAELPIDFVLSDEDGNTYDFRGRIDKIVWTKNEDTSYYTIIDYKSGQEGFEPQLVAIGKCLQLPLYQYAVENSPFESRYTGEGEFGGLAIIHPFASSLRNTFGKDGTLSEKNLIANQRMTGITSNDVGYWRSIDSSAFDESGKLRPKGGDLVKNSIGFTDPDGEDEKLIRKEAYTLESFNYSDLIAMAKSVAVSIVSRIRENEFDILPIGKDPEKHVSKGSDLVCSNCSYRDICYHQLRDAVDMKEQLEIYFSKEQYDELNWEDLFSDKKGGEA